MSRFGFSSTWLRGAGLAVLLTMAPFWAGRPGGFVSILAETLPVQSYSTSAGLAQNYVNRVVLDPRGYIWICTNEGFSRFDGYEFANFGIEDGLPNRNVRDLLITSAGEYWVATHKGLVQFDPSGVSARYDKILFARERKPMFTPYPLPVSVENLQVSALVEGKGGEIWCGTSVGLFRLVRKGQKWIPSRTALFSLADGKEYVRSILAHASGDVWVGLSQGVARYRPARDQVERYGKLDGLPDMQVSTIDLDRDGRLWAGTGRGLLELDPTVASNGSKLSRLLYPYATPGGFIRRVLARQEGLPGSWVRDLWQASDRTFWLATDRGLAHLRFDPTGAVSSVEGFTIENGLSDYFLTNLVGSPDGNLWIGSANAGLMKLALHGFTSHNFRDGVAAVVSVTSTAEGVPLVGGYVPLPHLLATQPADALGKGDPAYLQWRLGQLQAGRFRWVRPNVPSHVYFSSQWNQSSFQDRSGEWWIATQQGLYRFERVRRFEELATARPRAVYTTRDGLRYSQVTRLFEDARGDLWIATYDGQRYGLDRWKRADDRIEPISHVAGRSLLNEREATSFVEDRFGTLWIGLSHPLQPGGLATYREGQLKVLDSVPEAPRSNLFDLLVDRTGRLWMASTTQGVVRVDMPGAEIPTFRYYDRDDGLASNRVTSLAEDRYGRIYCGTGRGVEQINPQTQFIRHFTEMEGLALGNVDDIHLDSRGDLWFATTLGLSRLTPLPEPPRDPPAVFVDQIRYRGQPYPLSALGQREVALPTLPTDDHRLEIEYLGLNFQVGERLTYQAWLEGAESGWVDRGTQRILSYANLAPGDYRLHLRALNSRGEVSPQPAMVTFSISPPFWMQGWFFLLGAIAIFSAGAAIQYYRARQALRLEQLRLQISTDLHDEVGTSLSQIAIVSEVARQQLRRLDGQTVVPLLAQLEKVAETSRSAIDSMSDIVWSINPQRDSLQDLVQRMRRFASETLTIAEIRLRFEAPESDLPLKVECRRHLFLLFKEAIHNVVRHSRATEVRVRVSLSAQRLTLEVEDNGVGFDPAALPSPAQNGQGLSSLERRARAIGATLTLTSPPGAGTSLRLHLPLAHPRRLSGLPE